MTLEVEGVVDSSMDGQESLRGAGRSEPLHLALTPSRGLVGDLGTVVLAQTLVVSCVDADLSERGAIGSELCSDDLLRREALLP